MSSLSEQHFKKTKNLIKKISKNEIASWLLSDGYFPEQYVLPPCFHVSHFQLKSEPYYPVKIKKGNTIYHPPESELLNICFPKSELTDRIFGIIEPKLYHDMVLHIINDIDIVIDHLFSQNTSFYCYSFPIPVNGAIKGKLGSLRSGRMIYEFIEMAENDLVSEAHNFQFVVRTDIKNYYPSVYTHSLAWALHGKASARKDMHSYKLLGNKLDKLFQQSNDRCTNGLAIGPVISDLASEIILSAVDKNSSEELKAKNIKFVGVRFKDDYRVLCNNKSDADAIVKTIQRNLKSYNLFLNESKTSIKELPSGLFRSWILEYQPISLKHKTSITYKIFETTLLAVLEIDKKHPDTGIIDKFLGELVTKDYSLKLELDEKNILKTLSLLFLLQRRRSKVLPQILSIIELMIVRLKKTDKLVDHIFDEVSKHFRNDPDFLYDDLWIMYFLNSHNFNKPIKTSLHNNPLFLSIKNNRQEFFKTPEKIKLFSPIKRSGNKLLAKHLAIFPKR